MALTQLNYNPASSALGSLPFNEINDPEFLQEIQCRNQIKDDNDEYLQNLVHKLSTNAKHLKIAHLNVRGLRGKVDELQIFFKLCQFDVFGVTETRLTSEITDGEINIEDFTDFIRRHRQGRRGGGCVIYYR